MFDADEHEFLRAVSANLAEGARRGLLISEAASADGPEAPGLVVLSDDWGVERLRLVFGSATDAGPVPGSCGFVGTREPARHQCEPVAARRRVSGCGRAFRLA
jgi:hypothetical protein